MNRWEGLEEFVAVAETGGFSAAARHLGLSASQVSRQVLRLEERMQTRLFQRSTRLVRLTEAGQAFFQHCRHLQDGYDEALRTVLDLEQNPKGLLRLTCTTAYGERYVVPLVNELVAEHPQLQVEIDLDDTPRDLVQQGYDIGIRLGQLGDSRLVAVRLAERVMYVCATPAYLDRHGRPLNPADLERHNCLRGLSEHWLLQAEGREINQKVTGNWRCNSGVAVLDAALRGFGLCQLPDYYVRAHLREGRLEAVLANHQLHSPAQGVWALIPPRRNLSPKVRLVVERLRTRLGALTNPA
ncbi:MAG: LysR family transcriptional regulator [Zoogloea sp.]|uniref:LysR family transcriptional regulator n=1 Tax=Zoogloea sp. TaxID=49181 RepID=UPI00261DA993|nr:LysR family transcriptional regulator [Zoogloea sp.]MDD3329353.1 LysR family transcriptional regulator [Zoogloea sp.]